MTQSSPQLSLAQGLVEGQYSSCQSARFCLTDLIYWRDPRKSGVVFGMSMLLLLSLACFSIITVVSYLLLILLCISIMFRSYHFIVQAVQKSNDEHPFKPLLDMDVSIPPEISSRYVNTTLTFIKQGLRLFLVEDLMESLKLAVVMWMFTYVGAIFNGITILILADILLFAVPPLSENQTQIYPYVDKARAEALSVLDKLKEKIPNLREKISFPSGGFLKRFKRDQDGTESQPEDR